MKFDVLKPASVVYTLHSRLQLLLTGSEGLDMFDTQLGAAKALRLKDSDTQVFKFTVMK